jgi:cation:H+ antiporter
MGVSFHEFPIWGNVLLFLIAGAIVWYAGTRLSLYADAIAERKEWGQAFVGALFLGVVTSLPEIATTTTASAIGNAALAFNNLLGSVSAQLVVLAVVDLIAVRGALTFFSPKPVLLMSGVFLALELALAIAAVAMGEIASWGNVGIWPVILFANYLASLYFLFRYEKEDRWVAINVPNDEDHKYPPTQERARVEGTSTGRLFGLFAWHSVLVLGAGLVISSTGDALAEQTGLGSGLIGATLVAFATSLPETSTTYGAVRVGAFTMAVANIFGTNTLGVSLILFSDIAYREGLVIDAVGRFEIFLTALGIVLTCIYLWGLLERRDKTLMGMGIDSALVIAAWITGIAILFWIA